MSFFVYIIRCGDGSYYTGHTRNLEERIKQHSRGVYSVYTAGRHPLTLVFSTEFPTRYEALTFERKVKGWTRAKKEALINKDWEQVSSLSKKKR